MFALIFLCTILVIGCSGSLWAYRLDKKDWNYGMCPKCFSEWEHRDTDDQGGQMLCCSFCDNSTWISYPVKRKRKDYPLRLTTGVR